MARRKWLLTREIARFPCDNENGSGGAGNTTRSLTRHFGISEGGLY